MPEQYEILNAFPLNPKALAAMGLALCAAISDPLAPQGPAQFRQKPGFAFLQGFKKLSICLKMQPAPSCGCRSACFFK